MQDSHTKQKQEDREYHSLVEELGIPTVIISIILIIAAALMIYIAILPQ